MLHAVAAAGSFVCGGAALAGACCACLGGEKDEYDGLTVFKWISLPRAALRAAIFSLAQQNHSAVNTERHSTWVRRRRGRSCRISAARFL